MSTIYSSFFFALRRWLVYEGNEDIYNQGIFSDWSDKDNEATMYSNPQRAAEWPPIVYAKCLFFLDYPHGKYPENEKQYYDESGKNKQIVPMKVRIYNISISKIMKFRIVCNKL